MFKSAFHTLVRINICEIIAVMTVSLGHYVVSMVKNFSEINESWKGPEKASIISLILKVTYLSLEVVDRLGKLILIVQSQSLISKERKSWPRAEQSLFVSD